MIALTSNPVDLALVAVIAVALAVVAVYGAVSDR